ncbi:MAG: hypothetical protein DRO12_04050 [Thermoprotei archaeon]|nr:MAG: hypothetical protein DRO12_04050 [Thermoprotei archaeon]
MKELEKITQQKLSLDTDFRELIHRYGTRPSFYKEFFDYLFRMKHINDRVRYAINKYDSYTYKQKLPTLLCLLAMIITGTIIPLTLLYHSSTITPDLYGLYAVLSSLTSISFGLSSAFLMWIIYKEISK